MTEGTSRRRTSSLTFDRGRWRRTFFLSAHPNQTHSGLIDLDGLRFKERLHTPWLWLLGGSKDRLPPNRGKLNPAPSNVHQQLRRTIHEERDIRSLRNFNNPASYELNEKHEHIWLASRIITHGDDELFFFQMTGNLS